MSLTEYHATRKARLARLMTPPGGRDSSELEIVTDPSVLRAQTLERSEQARQARKDAQRERAQEQAKRRLTDSIERFLASCPQNAQSVPEVSEDEEPPIVPPRRVRVKDIVQACADFYEIELRDVVAFCNLKDIVLARQVAMYLAREMTLRTYVVLGKLFERDYSTVVHAHQKISRLVKSDRELADEVAYIRGMLE